MEVGKILYCVHSWNELAADESVIGHNRIVTYSQVAIAVIRAFEDL